MFAGFEGVDDFFVHLRDHVLEALRTKSNCDTTSHSHLRSIPTAIPALPTGNGDGSPTVATDNTGGKTAAEKMARTNASNLKATQNKLIMAQSHLIDCTHTPDTSSVWGRHGTTVTREHNDNTAGDSDPCFERQLKANNSVSPDLYPD